MKYLLPILFLSSFHLHAQKAPMKFGKIDMADLQMEVYEKDSSASAVILGDYGLCKIDYGSDQFQIEFERHVRIKILTKEGLDWADHVVSYYSPSDNDSERVGSIRGVTFNLEGNKIVENKLERDGIFDTKKNEYWSERKITMPQVREGSVIDLTYSVTSPYLFNYRDWQFQYTIPVRRSEYRPQFIEYYVYKQYMQGYVPLTTSETTNGAKTFTVRTAASFDPGNVMARTAAQSNNYTAESKQMRLVMNDVPAFKEEPYLSTPNNYISKINFELAGEDWPNSGYKDRTGSWEKINENYVKSEYFYKRVTGSSFLKKEVEDVLASLDNPNNLDKANAIYRKVRDGMRWNGLSARTAPPLRSSYTEGKGTAAEINLILASMLEKAGVHVDPVLISTRNHGFIRQQYPAVDQLNYVICRMEVDGKAYLLDATDPYLPFGMLPERCLNGEGMVVSDAGPQWIPLKTNAKHDTKISITASLSGDGVITGTVDKRYSGYAGRRERASFYRDSVEYAENLSKQVDWETFEYKLTNFSDYSKPVAIKSQFEYELEESGNVTYVNPVLIPMWESNPFKVKERAYPVDFASNISKLTYVTLEVPPGMIAESVPESRIIALPENAGKFTYSASVTGSKIVILNKLDLRKTIFTQDEYASLKEFFDLFIQMQQQLIVLKKT